MKHLLFLDIETTGLNPEKAELIELSAIRVSADFTEDLAEFDELVHPNEEIPPFITRLTGISNEMVQDAPEIEKVHEDFKKFLRPSDVICGHNIQFDIGFLQTKGFFIPNESLDTFPLSNILLPNEPSYSLEILTKKFNIDHKDAHRALADVKANIGLFLELKKAAEELSNELKGQYSEVLAKTDWTGNILFERAFSSPEKKLKKGRYDDQLSIFDSEPVSSKIPNRPEEKQIPDVPTLHEQKAGEKIRSFLQLDQKSLLSLPPEVRELSAAVEAVKSISERMFIAIPKAYDQSTPDGFFRYASPKKVFCSSAFESWKSKKSSFTETEIVSSLKIMREIQSGSSLIFSDLPLFREEWDVAKKWLSNDHIRCPSTCPAKQMQIDSQKHTRFFCDLSDIADVPAKKGIVIRSSRLADYLDSSSREGFSVKALEKWAESIQKDEKDFSDALLFGIGLLKRYIRERTGESPYRKYLVLSESILQEREIQNLSDGFSEAKKQMFSLFPENVEAQEQLQNLIDFFQNKIPQNECRFITIHPDDALYFARADVSLEPSFTELFEKKQSVVFTGKALLSRCGKHLLGEGLPFIENQEEIVSEFDYARKSHFCIPTFGGNTKMADSSVTLKAVKNLLPLQSKNILVLFPGAGLVETFCTGIADSAEENGFQVLTIHGSAGKAAEQLKNGKTILVATSTNWQKIDFSTANIGGCVQHRLLFDPPPDPPQEARLTEVADEFLEVALPKAIQKVRYLLGGLTAGDHSFFWLLLDSHFQREGGFTDSILSALPPNLPVRKMGVPEMPESVDEFLSSS